MRKDKEQDKTLQAVLYSAAPPSKAQRDHLLTFLSNKYHAQVELIWQEQEGMDGFRIAIDADVYEWTTQSRLHHLSLRWLETLHQKGEVIPLLRDSLESWTPAPMVEQMGRVRQVFDGIVLADGLEHATYGEILLFPDGVRGMVQSLSKKRVGCIVFGESNEIVEGSVVRRTGKTAGIPVGNGFLGRVVDALGSPIDGGGPIAAQGYRALEHPAPGILERAPVSRPMATGVLAIDSMFPIGRGQRELIIGDRQTGKTAIAVDTILNQKDNDVVCIYVAIGQKVSTVAQLTQTLRVHGALDYTIVVCAGAGDGAPYQYIAPYAGCALGEFFMEQGRDVLIIYDDLSKHAIAYRTLSLLLGRSPGREAYPGDVFYLHSRLLERAAQLSEARGGGSMTALPIVETQAGDVSAYIPTNIISITDGQIFLESRLFFAGQRPAVNVGLSVSRVGSSAQTEAMRVASGALRLDLAQYREMEAFTQFASELDEGTTYRLEHGQRLMRLLRQEQSHPRSLFEQVVLLTAAMGHTMQKVPLDRLHDHVRGMLRFIDKQDPLLREEIEGRQQLSEQSKQHIIDLANDYLWLSSKEN